MTPDTWLVFLGIAEVVLIFGSVVYLRKQIQDEHDWKRRRSTYDFLSEVVLGRFADLRKRLPDEVNVYSTDQVYTDVQAFLSPEQATMVWDMLNNLEVLALGVKHQILDEEIAYDSFRNLVVCHARWAAPLIEHERRAGTSFWRELDELAAAWQQKMDQRRPGRPPLGKLAQLSPLAIFRRSRV